MLSFLIKIRKHIIAFLIAAYAALFVIIYQLPDNKFHIYFLNVGQGDSILIKTPENHEILVDGGPQDFVMQELSEVLPFFVKHLDLIVLTHPHKDHVDGLIEVLKRFKVDNILISGVQYDSPDYKEFLQEIQAYGIKVFIAESHTDFKFGAVVFDVLYPQDEIIGETFDNLNNSSIAMRIAYAGKHVLLTGDLEVKGEAGLLATGADLQADIFKAGHHGSRTSSSIALLKKVKPEIVVIQCGKDNQFGHPHQETLDNLKKLGIKNVYRNDLDGRVEFVF